MGERAMIYLEPYVAMNLENLCRIAGTREIQGVGFVRKNDNSLVVYDVLLLAIGSGGYTEVDGRKLYEAIKDRPDKENCHLWWHKHPVNGWSGTDLDMIINTPMGSLPQIVRWSASIVRTPNGWIGRIDNHIKNTSVVAEVVPNISFALEDSLVKAMKEKPIQRDIYDVWDVLDTDVLWLDDLEEDEEDPYDDEFWFGLGVEA